MAELGQRIRLDHLAGRVGRFLLVLGAFQRLQHDLWLAGRGDRLHHLDMDIRHHHLAWRRTERRNGAPALERAIRATTCYRWCGSPAVPAGTDLVGKATSET